MPEHRESQPVRPGPINPTRLAVILARPENAENIGLVARAMKNTGFADLRIVRRGSLPSLALKTAVHAENIVQSAPVFPDLADAVSDREAVFAASAKPRKASGAESLTEAVARILAFPSSTRIGLLFGNERTGLRTDELRHANFVFTIPQAGRQPSYNLASAVLLTLFALFTAPGNPSPERAKPLARTAQEETIGLILKKLEARKFIHPGNRDHVAAMIFDLFGRLAMTDNDRRLLLALFAKGVDFP